MAIEAIEGPPDGKGKEVQPSNTKLGQQFKANSSQTTGQGQAQLTDEEIQRLQQQEELSRQQKLAELREELRQMAGADTSAGQQTAQQEAAAQAVPAPEQGEEYGMIL